MGKFISYSSEHGYETHDSATEAKKSAQSMISDFLFDGWDEEVNTVVWGQVNGCAAMVDKQPAPEGSEFDYTCNYIVKDIADWIRPLIESEISDFCAGLHSPGEPETPEQIQQQLLSRIASVFGDTTEGGNAAG